jgi:hypothetical protein
VGYWVIFAFLGVSAVAWIALASIPLRRVRLRLPLLVLHVVASVLLIRSPGTRELWVLTFGPGLLVAVGRILYTVSRGLHRLCRALYDHANRARGTRN